MTEYAQKRQTEKLFYITTVIQKKEVKIYHIYIRESAVITTTHIVCSTCVTFFFVERYELVCRIDAFFKRTYQWI